MTVANLSHAVQALRAVPGFAVRLLVVIEFAGSLTLIVGCQQPLDDGEVWSGNYGASKTALTVVADTEGEWRGLWEIVGKAPPRALPRGNVAVGIFLGQRGTGGYQIEVVSAQAADAAFLIEYREVVPSGIVTLAGTTPYLIRLFSVDDDLPVVVSMVP